MRRFAMLFFGLLLSGCVSTQFAPFDSTYIPRPGAPDKKIDVYSTPASIKQEYKEIGLITADDNYLGKSEADLIKHLVKKARSIGADAIILGETEQKNSSTTAAFGSWWTSHERIGRAVAIVYIEGD